MNRLHQFSRFGLFLFPASLALPIPLKYKSIFLAVFLGTLLVCADFTLFRRRKTYSDRTIVIFILFFFSSLAIDFIRDGSVAFREVRLAFLITPLIFCVSSELLSKQYENILRAFLVGIYTYIFYAFSFAIYFYQLERAKPFAFDYYLKYVLYNYLPGAIHHTYIGMYISFALIVVLFALKLNIKKKALFGLPLLFAIVFLGSKLSILVAALIVIYWGLFGNKNRYKKTSIIGILLLFGAFAAGLWQTDIFRTFSNSFKNRIDIFNCSFKGITDNWLLGIGNDKVKAFMANCTQSLMEMDTHNMYLQELLSSGILGFMVLLAMFIHLLLKSHKNPPFKIFIITFMIIGLVEHLFNTQLGVTYFVFFTLLFEYSNQEDATVL